ncbi:hypothetical protein AB0B89_31595 [Sphaerisporangium sp. NPDC049002]|uniref:hypothetical protein n=1 Tax=unclassified Sphaerisporangium TaxID=2630420 RepID=UPI0033FEF45F
MRLLFQHRQFAAVFALGLALRVLTMVGYSPVVWFEDAFDYVGVAERLRPYPVRPSGYPILLWAMRPLHSFAVVVGLQHLSGLAMGVMVYALVLRRTRNPRKWSAVLASAPVLLDAYQIFFEHTILSDPLFSFLVVTAVTVTLWTPRVSLRRAASVGLLLAAAALTRSIGVALLPVFAGYLVVNRSGWRTLLVTVVAAAVPLGCYAAWYGSWHGSPAINGGSGVWLWARTMPFADCQKIRPAADEAVLCPAQPVGRRPSSPHFIWADWSPLRNVPGHSVTTRGDLFHPGIDRLAGNLARRAISSQPSDYLQLVVEDLKRALNWRRGPDPKTAQIGFNRYAFPNVSGGPPPDEIRIPGATIRQDLQAYERGQTVTRFCEPAAEVMRTYQSLSFMPGPIFGALFAGATVVSAMGWARRSSGEVVLPLVSAIGLVISPVLVTAYDSRYLLPAIPLLCATLVIAANNLVASPRLST